MASKFDLFIVPLHRKDGHDQPSLAGLYFAASPRRAARSRRDERLILLFSVEGSLLLGTGQIQGLLKDLADSYFQTSGSVTSALREQAERLNAYLLSHNQKAGAEKPPSLGLLSVLVQREQGSYLAQCGPVHAFLLDEFDIQNFFDPQRSGRGLGLSQTTDIRFSQIELRPGDLFLAMPSLPEGWNENTLKDVRGQKLATLRRRFLGHAGADLQAVLLAAQTGPGDMRLLSAQQSEGALEEAVDEMQDKFLQREDGDVAPAWESIELPDDDEVSSDDTQPVAVAELETDPTPKEVHIEPSTPASVLERISDWANEITERFAPVARNLLMRMLPEETNFDLPPATMAAVAGLVPVAVVILVSVVYLQFGRGQLYDNYLTQAQGAAAAAEAREDPAGVRQAWEVALDFASQAEAYDSTEDARALRSQAQDALDKMDAIERLEFQPALFGALPSDVKIVEMQATNTELYMLNSSDGGVMRAFLTGGGYQIDNNFQCGPGPYGGYIVSALIDIALLPRDNPQGAALVAMDGDGNLIYCIVDERPLATPLEPPDSNWGNPIAIAVENEDLHVLDPLTNAVWLYFGDEFAYVDQPRFFFGAEVPGMQDVIDLALQDENLYLLSLNGEMAVCQFNDDIENPTTCEDPAEYTDNRPGREDSSSIEGANFLQLQTTSPPEPSVFLLDPIVPSIYQFSLRLSLVRQYRTASELPEEVVTAFAVSPNRALFLAYENQLFIGFLP
jgi:hypothetical protein